VFFGFFGYFFYNGLLWRASWLEFHFQGRPEREKEWRKIYENNISKVSSSGKCELD